MLLSTLSVDCLTEVLQFLDVEKIVSFGATCRKAHDLVHGCRRGLWVPVLERMSLGVLQVSSISELMSLRLHVETLQTAIRQRRLRTHLSSLQSGATSGAMSDAATQGGMSRHSETDTTFDDVIDEAAGGDQDVDGERSEGGELTSSATSTQQPSMPQPAAATPATSGTPSRSRVTFSGVDERDPPQRRVINPTSYASATTDRLSMITLLVDERLAESFVELLADSIVRFCDAPVGYDATNEGWRKMLSCRLFALGFERFSSHVRGLDSLIRRASPNDSNVHHSPLSHHVTAHKRVRVLEYFATILRYQSTFLTTPVSDIEAVQEVCSSIASSPIINAGLELLKYVQKYFGRQGQLLYDECICIADALTACAFLSEISDHPNAQSKYESVWAAYRGEQGLLRVTKPSPSAGSESGLDVWSVPLAPETHGCLTATQQHRLKYIHTVLIADLIGYLLRLPKRERKSLLENIQSIYRLTVGEAAALLNRR